MKAKDLRKLTKTELEKRLQEKQTELLEFDFDLKIGQESNFADRKKKRKIISRILTVLRNNEFAVESDEKKDNKKDDKKQSKSTKDSKKETKSDKITKSKK